MAKKIYLGNERPIRKNFTGWILAVLFLVVAAGAVYFFVPTLQERVTWHLEQWYTRILYFVKPPEKVVFDPSRVTEAPDPREANAAMTLEASNSGIPTLEPTPTLIPLPTLTATTSPLPLEVDLKGVRYMDQHGLYNYCGPANLAMLLSYWKWEGDRIDVGKYAEPYRKDKNVMPYELADYVSEKTDLNIIIRVGGDIDTIKRFLAGGFPVMIEKGAFIVDINGVLSWMGHYNVITGYKEADKLFIVQDSYFGENQKMSYEKILGEWRAFNFLYMVAFTYNRYNEIISILGEDAEENTNYLRAANKSSNEIVALEGIDKFFAWWNRGDNLAELQDYGNAANCFDEAFKMYPTIPEDQRPWRVMWYRTGPYKAYYGVGRYQAIIDLATTTLDAMSEPYLEESYYWRARAEWELGNDQAAIADFRKSLDLHPKFGPTLYQMELLGIK